MSAQARRERYFQAIADSTVTAKPPPPVERSAERASGAAVTAVPRSEVTRRLCAAAHARPDRLEPVRAAWRHLHAYGFGPDSVRALRASARPVRRRRPPERLCPPLGEPLAKWTIGKVLLARARAVPSFDYDLGPVLAHCLAARRQWRVRRTVLLVVLAWIAWRFPLGVALWAVAGLLATTVARFPGRRRRWRSRAWAGALTLLLVPLTLVVLGPTSQLGGETLRALEFAALAFLAVRIVDRLVALVRALACDRVHGDRRPWAGPRKRARIAMIERAQELNALPYELFESDYYAAQWRFIGAGKSPWGRHTISIKMQGKPDEEDETVRKDFEAFTIEELLSAVRDDLEDLTVSEPPFHPLSCRVREIWGVPDRRWVRLPRDPAGSDPGEERNWEQAQEATASGVATRRYLSAQVGTWSGQLVVTALASAVIEGRELHFVLRPHVLSPLFNEVEEAVDPELLRRVSTFAQVPVQASGDLVVLVRTGWRILKWCAREHTERATDEGEFRKVPKKPLPVSLRERYSPVYTSDMHVSEDAVRHIEIIQSRMFTTVQDFLEDRGVDVTEYERQVQNIMTIVQAGDNSIIQASTAGRDVSDSRQETDRFENRGSDRPDGGDGGSGRGGAKSGKTAKAKTEGEAT
ncbi:hypothetical protein [Streptomyces sp. NPDC050528]|uniref:hypothetical protein n=1 Tax=Streptomyces sp. NPDC050528 TaxID=3365623 RepID=UPI0037A173C1